MVGSDRDEGREDYISRPSPLICELIAIVWTLQVNDLRETLYCTYIYSLEECVNVFFTKMEDTYRLDSNEKWIIDINLTYEEREQAIKAYVSILKELGIEKTCTIIEQLLDEENLTLLALGQAIIRNR